MTNTGCWTIDTGNMGESAELIQSLLGHHSRCCRDIRSRRGDMVGQGCIKFNCSSIVQSEL